MRFGRVHGRPRKQLNRGQIEYRYEKDYTPLRKDDIDSEPPPPLPTRDAYLQGRLQRFYAELAQYTPGVSRAAYEERLATLGDGLLPPAPDPYVPLMSSHACVWYAVSLVTSASVM
jgi:hypothetical protein